jgi:lipopolysaccharide/colanic/teichoic acid biosynthesis glycosyltransferase
MEGNYVANWRWKGYSAVHPKQKKSGTDAGFKGAQLGSKGSGMEPMNAFESGKFRRVEAVLYSPTAANNNFHLAESEYTVVGGTRTFWISKRILDVALSLMMLPVLAIAAAAIFVLNFFFNPGPLLYSQIRVGMGGELFWIWKFRTVISDEKAASKKAKGPKKKPGSPRGVTPFGAILRTYRFDELPQIINVLRGDMSLIGPRPETLENIEKFSHLLPGFGRRNLVKPGLSGLSQVTIGYTSCHLTYSQKLQYDCEYISNAGWKMEGYVFLRTIWVICTGFGAA